MLTTTKNNKLIFSEEMEQKLISVGNVYKKQTDLDSIILSLSDENEFLETTTEGEIAKEILSETPDLIEYLRRVYNHSIETNLRLGRVLSGATLRFNDIFNTKFEDMDKEDYEVYLNDFFQITKCLTTLVNSGILMGSESSEILQKLLANYRE